MGKIMFWEAVRRAHDEELANDPLVIVMGEDIGVAGGTYKATQGLYEKYGEERVMDTPISENGFTGLGIGASFLGARPIIEIMSVNFAWLAMDQIFNTAAKVRYMSGGQLEAPIVVRSPGGTAHQLGSQHSARMEKVFMGIAGLMAWQTEDIRVAQVGESFEVAGYEITLADDATPGDSPFLVTLTYDVCDDSGCEFPIDVEVKTTASVVAADGPQIGRASWRERV